MSGEGLCVWVVWCGEGWGGGWGGGWWVVVVRGGGAACVAGKGPLSARQHRAPCSRVVALNTAPPLRLFVQEVSIIDVRKEINFCKKVSEACAPHLCLSTCRLPAASPPGRNNCLPPSAPIPLLPSTPPVPPAHPPQTGIPVLGVVENMSGLRQPLSSFKFYGPAGEDVTAAVLAVAAAAVPGGGGGGGAVDGGGSSGQQGGGIVAETTVFHASGGGAVRMAADMAVPFLGAVPLDSALSRAGEEGRSVFDAAGGSSSGPALQAIITKLLATVASVDGAQQAAA